MADWFPIVVSLTALLLLPLVVVLCLAGGRRGGHQPTIPANPLPPRIDGLVGREHSPHSTPPRSGILVERPQSNPRLIVTEQRGSVPPVCR